MQGHVGMGARAADSAESEAGICVSLAFEFDIRGNSCKHIRRVHRRDRPVDEGWGWRKQRPQTRWDIEQLLELCEDTPQDEGLAGVPDSEARPVLAAAGRLNMERNDLLTPTPSDHRSPSWSLEAFL